MTAILWLRRDLRLDDNPALQAALATGAAVLPVYIHAPDEESPWEPGGASRWWLHASLRSLDAALRERGSRLHIARGDSLNVLKQLAAETGATQVHWSRLYDPSTRERDTRIKQALRAAGLRCESHGSALLFEPWEISTAEHQPYRVFSAFWRACVKALTEPRPVAAPDRLPPPPEIDGGVSLDALGLLPRIPWDDGLKATWNPGEFSARERTEEFLDGQVADYSELRDQPGIPGTSRLAPHLHFGEISPRRILSMVIERFGDPTAKPVEAFVREVGWREFGYHLLYHFPQTPTEPLNRQFADFPWASAEVEAQLRAWQRGQTGIPMVDAGMRELWHSGWMHNRVRMVVASFLTKNLLIPWQDGARWFWDTLVDADLASNTLGWQWTAGCGADAAPYFRVFNPVRQGERFDPDGRYVRRWCPELRELPDKYLHQPWAAPETLLRSAGVKLGESYPAPMVDLGKSRARALAAYEQVKG
ncbi:deoxyribodipyrimidine photo-lyase [Thiorhodococcus mannitoliphagus]|uniref:Deoxyribodipyrimidine photo-lyase n=1 Tax=Thiorhodococcus mannitoliphagus TaxID=329406 RepID=A0A6P1DQ14_9GAMM|nr:deoxyribodipyrimidine photo-lyase [Thiorhodococcus mannitoliphagus]NEX20108.1 deoxyribodipyrimidine photo-lyase [Thiorhodococcus mannitoliphagus]